MFDAEAQLHGGTILELKEEHQCSEHDGICYKSGGLHYPLNRWKIKEWAAAIAAKKATHWDPPDGLFREDDARQSRVVKSRGRTGPRSALADSPPRSEAAQLLTAVLPLLTSMATNMRTPLSNTAINIPITPRNCKRGRSVSFSSPLSSLHNNKTPLIPSSPAPPVEDELRLCLEAFGRAKSLSSDIVDAAFQGLSDKGYAPDSIGVIRVERIAELTQFREGQAASFMKFAREWSNKVEHKRAKVAVPSTP